MSRSNDDKTSAVHFLRFELDNNMITALKDGANLSAGITHTAYNHTVDVVSDNIKGLLMKDLD